MDRPSPSDSPELETDLKLVVRRERRVRTDLRGGALAKLPAPVKQDTTYNPSVCEAGSLSMDG